MDFYDSFHYLTNHIIFDNHFQECLDIWVAKVNPKTCEIDDDTSKNTKVEVWLECGPYKSECTTHNIDLDCGGDTFEEAIIELAKLVKEIYGDDEKEAIKRVRDKYGADVW